MRACLLCDFLASDLQFFFFQDRSTVQACYCSLHCTDSQLSVPRCVAVLVNLLLLNSKMLSKETDMLVHHEGLADALPSYLIPSFCELMFFSLVFICFLDSSSLAVIILMHN
jgi:hypothetical protein